MSFQSIAHVAPTFGSLTPVSMAFGDIRTLRKLGKLNAQLSGMRSCMVGARPSTESRGEQTMR